MLKVISTARQYSQIPQHLSEHLDFAWRPPQQQQFLSHEMSNVLKGSNVAIIGDDELSEEVLATCGDLQLIVRWGVGTDNVDLKTASRLGIKVVNTPGLFGEDVADLALGIALSLIRGVSEFDGQIKSGGWSKETKYSMRSLNFSVLGFGAVGREISKLLGSFSQHISVYDPMLRSEDAPEGARVANSLLNALEGSNCAFVAMPLTSDTKGLLGIAETRILTSPRFVVNVSRGEILRQSEMFEALDSGLLEGLGMDVFEEEPLPFGDLPARLSHAVFTSHNASNTFMSISRANLRVDELLSEHLKAKGLA